MSMSTTTHPRILFSFGPPEPKANPYTTLLSLGVGAVEEVKYFSWLTAFAGRYDIFHVQWPESLVRPYSRSARRFIDGPIKFVLAISLLAVNRLRGKQLVWTVHNRKPHERGSRLERVFVRLFQGGVDCRIFLNAGEEDDLDRPSCVILHPDYRPVAQPQFDEYSTDLLLFGHLRPYKGVEHLIALVRDNVDLGTLHVAGLAADEQYGQALKNLAKDVPSVVVTTQHLDQVQLNNAVRQARLIVLPYEYVYNSGSLLLALTLHTPVLIRASPTTRAIANEVGHGWVSLFEGGLEAEDIQRTLRLIESLDVNAGPNLAARSWKECIRRHIELYDHLSMKRVRLAPRFWRPRKDVS